MFDIHQSIYDRHGEHDERKVANYINGLGEEFAKSEEFVAFRATHEDWGYAGLLLEYAIENIGVMPAQMSLFDFDEIVFKIFPRKVSTEPETAPAIIAELRAFWTFLRRQYRLKSADAILPTLTDEATERLHRLLSNPRNFSPAKAMMMAGKNAGLDMSTQEGLNAAMQLYNSRLTMPPLPLPSAAEDDAAAEDGDGDFADALDYLAPLPPPSPLTPRERAQKRKERKAQRKAKKKNRRK